MTFEIMGQKENWLTFAKEGNGIELKGNIMSCNNDILTCVLCMFYTCFFFKINCVYLNSFQLTIMLPF